MPNTGSVIITTPLSFTKDENLKSSKKL